jgi:hypothetical protein
MSKTGRGILGGPGPYFCLYSPECVEGEFSELRLAGVLGSWGVRGYRKSRCRKSGRGPAGLRPSPWYT